jgi:hypothetical protein
MAGRRGTVILCRIRVSKMLLVFDEIGKVLVR